MRRTLAPALAVLAGLGALAACAPEADPTVAPTPAATTPIPDPTPTTPALLVGPGEKPPIVFDGDCAAALSPEDVRAVTGVEMTLASSDTHGDVGNVGGLGCSWNAGEAAVRVEILPRAGLGDAEFPADQVEYYFEDCNAEWVCSSTAQTDDVWLAASFQSFPGMDRPTIDEWTAALADVVFENHSAAESEPWTRDQSGWWPELDCEAVAATLSQEMGTVFTGDAGGYIDPPLPGVMLAAEASRWSNCYLLDGSRAVDLYSAAGEAWTLPRSAEDQAFPTGVPGITAWLDSGFQSTTAAGYTLTDGVNALTAYIPTDAAWSAEEALRALAVAAAADWD